MRQSWGPKFTVLVGSLVALSLVTGVGAFTAITTDRPATLDIAGDEAAALGLVPHSGPNGAYAQERADGLLELSLAERNPNLGTGIAGGAGVTAETYTIVHRVFNVTNWGTQPVGVWITETSPEVTFTTVTESHGPIDGEARAITLAPGGTAEVGLVIDTRGRSGEARLLESITVHAVALEVTGPIDDGGDSDDGSDGGTIEPAPDPGWSVEDWPASRRDRYNTGSSTVTGPRTNLTEAWSTSFKTRPYDHLSPVVADGRVFFGTQEPEVVALNATTGAVEWRVTSVGTPLSSPVVTPSGVYVITEFYDYDAGGWQYTLYKLDPATGTVSWGHSLPDGDPDGSGPTVVDGVVYHAGEDGVVRALDNRTGTILWNATIGIQARGRPAVHDGSVYVTSRTGYSYQDPPHGRVIALNATDGSVRWQLDRSRDLESSIVVANGTGFIVDGRNRTFAVDLATGEVRWETAVSGNTVADPAVADGRLFVVTVEDSAGSPGTTYALDTNTGAVDWEVQNGLSLGQSRPTVAGGVVYSYDRTDFDNSLTGRSVVDGTLLFRYPFNFADSALAIDDTGAIYVGGNHNVVPRVYKLVDTGSSSSGDR